MALTLKIKVYPQPRRINRQSMQQDTKNGYIRVNCQSQNPKQVAAAVACSVTVQASQCHWVARNGNESLFALLEVVLPQVVRAIFRIEAFRTESWRLPAPYSSVNKIDMKLGIVKTLTLNKMIDPLLILPDHAAQKQQESTERKGFGSCHEQEAARELWICLC